MSRRFGSALGVGTTDSVPLTSFTMPSKFSAWCRYWKNGLGGSSFGRLFEKTGPSGKEITLSINTSTELFIERDFSGANPVWTIADADANQVGRWNDIYMTYDDSSTSNAPRVWVNGRSVTVTPGTAATGTPVNTSSTFYIGNRSDGLRNFDGLIAGGAFWSELGTIADALALLAGVPAHKIRPWALIDYVDMEQLVPISRKYAKPIVPVGTRIGPFARRPTARPPQFSVATGAYSLACGAGSFVLSGQTAGLSAQRRIAGAAGSFVLAGQAAGVGAQRRVAGAAGTFSLTGQAAGLWAARSLASAAGVFSLSGQAARLAALRNLPAGAGSFVLAGQTAGLVATRRLASGAGAFVLTGIAARLAALRNLLASAGAFVLTGQTAGLRSARNLPSGTGAFVLSGQAATLTYQAGHTLAAAPGSFILTGIAARLAATRILVATKGTFSLTGQTAGLSAQRRLTSAAGAFTLTGRAAVLSSQRRLTSAPGSFILAGQAATLRRGARLGIGTGVFILTGQEVLLSGSSALIGGGSPARTFSATIREATFKGRAASTTFKGARRDDTFRRQG